MRLCYLAAGIAMLASSIVHAEQMSGPAVAEMMSEGKLRFRAGSVGTFKSNGSYIFRHSGSREKGNYTISDKGIVTIHDDITNKDISFYFDTSDNGVVSLIYLDGPGKGKAYALR